MQPITEVDHRHLWSCRTAYEGFAGFQLEYTRAVANLWQWVYGTDEDPNLSAIRTDPKPEPIGANSRRMALTADIEITNLLGAYPFEPLRGEHGWVADLTG